MGSGSRPGHGTCLLSSSANFTQSARWARVMGTSGTPSTTSALGPGRLAVETGLVWTTPLGVELEDEHAASRTPLPMATIDINKRCTIGAYQ